jgi:hypothetical protein
VDRHCGTRRSRPVRIPAGDYLGHAPLVDEMSETQINGISLYQIDVLYTFLTQQGFKVVPDTSDRQIGLTDKEFSALFAITECEETP